MKHLWLGGKGAGYLPSELVFASSCQSGMMIDYALDDDIIAYAHGPYNLWA